PDEAAVGYEDSITVDETLLQLLPLDPVAALPAPLEIGRLVDIVVVGTGEAKTFAERVLDERAIVGEIGCKDPADHLCPVCFGHSALLFTTLWSPSGNSARPPYTRTRKRDATSTASNWQPGCCSRCRTSPT